jgi:hypothetical protein
MWIEPRIHIGHSDDRTTFRSLLPPDFFDSFIKRENPGIKANALLLQVISALYVLCESQRFKQYVHSI